MKKRVIDFDFEKKAKGNTAFTRYLSTKKVNLINEGMGGHQFPESWDIHVFQLEKPFRKRWGAYPLQDVFSEITDTE